ncbi:MAG: phosphoglycerate kinase [Alphaproteobacteria bacterium]|nr:phosphoglycerate kinase [Alphaproteobacteria bacterium]OJV15302.1 MAG: phosphoglycerate kinase [Alphaproteobacteria bacterium 33-17]
MKDFTKADLNNKKVLLRLDLNVPITNGVIKDLTRVKKSLPTLEALIKQNAKVLVLTHLGRPKGIDPNFSVKPVFEALKELIPSVSIQFESDINKAKELLNSNQVVLFENIRFDKREEEGSIEFARELAGNMDVFINDAFSCCHRSHTSISFVNQFLPSYPGLLLNNEITNLENIVLNPKKPVTAIVGGSKVSTKIDILKNLINKVDYLVIGGAMANTFLKLNSVNIGASLYEEDYIESARQIALDCEKSGCKIILPVDGIIAKKLSDDAEAREENFDLVQSDEMILDIGSKSVTQISEILEKSASLIWNGPVGAYEFKPFANGSIAIAKKAAELTKQGKLISVAGGGDVNAAINIANCDEDFTYISTAGGAFLEWLEGKELPGIKALK